MGQRVRVVLRRDDAGPDRLYQAPIQLTLLRMTPRCGRRVNPSESPPPSGVYSGEARHAYGLALVEWALTMRTFLRIRGSEAEELTEFHAT